MPSGRLTAATRRTSSSSPTIVGDPRPLGDGDSVITFNFRPDRMRQIVRALGEPGFTEFDRRGVPRVHLTTMTRYQEDWDYPVAFPEARPEITLARVLADRGDRQLHVAETEKYAHVTYFFNGGEEDPYPGEERALVPSPRDVATYDEKPEMSAEPAAAAFVDRWRAAATRTGRFASASSISRTRTWSATPATSRPPSRAVEAADRCLGQVLSAVLERGGGAIVTADHGNAEEMLTPDGGPQTAHSLNPGAVRGHGAGGDPRRSGNPGRRGADGARDAGNSAAGGDDTAARCSTRRLAARLLRRVFDQLADAVDLVLHALADDALEVLGAAAVEVHDHDRRDHGGDQQEQEHQRHEAGERPAPAARLGLGPGRARRPPGRPRDGREGAGGRGRRGGGAGTGCSTFVSASCAAGRRRAWRPSRAAS